MIEQDASSSSLVRRVRLKEQFIQTMVSSDIPEAFLSGSSGNRIPLLGYGTAEYPFGASPQTVKESVLRAIKLGYRHFDTAALYKSEQPLGEAIQEALRAGLINSRDELFITSKLSSIDGHRSHVVPAIERTLENLKLDYLDLYLIHFPVSLRQDDYEYPFRKDQILPMDLKSVWEKMEECQKLGFTKSIGVSNFTCKKLETLLAIAKIPPAVNQVEINPVWQQEKLRKYCKGKGIHVTAYSPLGAKGTVWGTNWVMDCDVLKEIAETRGKSVAQVSLRWVYEQGVSVLVKSFDKERMKENLDILDWELSPEDNRKIRGIRQRRSCRAMDFVHKEGPYKSLHELWDGEIEESTEHLQEIGEILIN